MKSQPKQVPRSSRTRKGVSPGDTGTGEQPQPYPHELLEDPRALAQYNEWSEEVYRDFLACQRGELDASAFAAKYQRRVSILCLDMTSFTKVAIRHGGLNSLLRIFDVQKVCAPIFRDFGAQRVRAFADDFTVLFDSPETALDAALEVHRRIALFNRSDRASSYPAECCIGIGYGDVFAIGPDQAMGDEMNRASKLGEDTAKAGETLITELAYSAVRHRPDCRFEERIDAELPFPYYSVTPAR